MMLLHFFTILLLASGCAKDKGSAPVVDPPSKTWQLVWYDEFSAPGLPDASKWSYDTDGNGWGWGNNEAQNYTAGQLKNSEVRDGKLYITAVKEDNGGKKYTSARLISRNKGDWTYGKVEVRALLPSGRGIWPAIWMLPTDSEYGGWPASGEIDIMEHVGYDPYWVVASAHTQSYNHTINTQKSGKIKVDDIYTAYHNYILEWDATEYRIYVDDKLYFTFKNENTGYKAWPFNRRFFLLLNVAVGGNWGGAQGIDDTIFPQQMVIDYVRVYQKK